MDANPPIPANPLLFAPAMEHAQNDEAQTIAGLADTLHGIQETTFGHSGHATRSVHAKSHGVLTGTLTVAENLPAVLAQGLFAKPGTYTVAMRFSTIPGDTLPDTISTPRGVAIKVLGVEGARLPGSEGDTTQDFILVNGPAFAAPNPQKFLGNLKTLAGTTDRIEGVKEVVSRIARATEGVLEAFGHKSPLVITLGGQPAVQILGETFYSQTPFLFGPYVCKVSLKPVAPTLTALTGKPLSLDTPDALRTSLLEYFGQHDAEWALQVQLNTGLDDMPIEDASVIWPEDKSPYVTVAHITAPKQNSWSAAGKTAIDEHLSFSPWHGLAAHRPLGAVNRARRETYAKSAAFRGSHNGCPMHEPKEIRI